MRQSENSANMSGAASNKVGNRWAAFAAKEIMESLRTKRILVIFCVFVISAIMGVVLARFIGELMAALLSADGGAPFTIEVPPPVWQDSYAQVFSSLTEIGVIAVIMLFMGSILREKTTGTIDLMMAKGLTTTVFVLVKFAVGAVIIMLALYTAVFVAFGYTFVLFEYAGNIGDVLFGATAFGVFALMILAVTLLWSAVAKSTAISAVLGLGSFFVISLLSVVPVIGRFMPGGLGSYSVSLAVGGGQERLLPQMAVAAVISAVCLWGAMMVLRKREG